MIVLEVIAPTPEAERELWRFVLDIDWVASIEYDYLPTDSALVLLLAEPRRLQQTLSDALWVRLVDVGEALQSRALADGPPVVLEVEDAFCPWNAGRWHVEAGKVHRTDDAADLRLDVVVARLGLPGGFIVRRPRARGPCDRVAAGSRFAPTGSSSLRRGPGAPRSSDGVGARRDPGSWQDVCRAPARFAWPTWMCGAACGSMRSRAFCRMPRSTTSRRPAGACPSISGSSAGFGSRSRCRSSTTARSRSSRGAAGWPRSPPGRRWSLRGDRMGRIEVDSVWIHLNSYVIRPRIQIHHNSIGLLFNAEERFDRCRSAGADMDWRPVVGGAVDANRYPVG